MSVMRSILLFVVLSLSYADLLVRFGNTLHLFSILSIARDFGDVTLTKHDNFYKFLTFALQPTMKLSAGT